MLAYPEFHTVFLSSRTHPTPTSGSSSSHSCTSAPWIKCALSNILTAPSTSDFTNAPSFKEVLLFPKISTAIPSFNTKVTEAEKSKVQQPCYLKPPLGQQVILPYRQWVEESPLLVRLRAGRKLETNTINALLS